MLRMEYILEKIKKEELSEFLRNNPSFHKGYPDKLRKRHSEKMKGDRNPSKRPEVRNKLSKSNSGKNNGMYGKGYLISGSKNGMYGRSGELNPMYGVHLVPWNKGKTGIYSEATINKIRNSVRKLYANNKTLKLFKVKPISKTEQYIADYLSNYFEVIQQFRIPNSRYKHKYDMLIKLPNGVNLLLEYDGDKFHDGGYKDKLREKVALKHNYSFLVIKECDYNSKGGLKYVKSRVAEFFPELLNYSLNK